MSGERRTCKAPEGCQAGRQPGPPGNRDPQDTHAPGSFWRGNDLAHTPTANQVWQKQNHTDLSVAGAPEALRGNAGSFKTTFHAHDIVHTKTQPPALNHFQSPRPVWCSLPPSREQTSKPQSTRQLGHADHRTEMPKARQVYTLGALCILCVKCTQHPAAGLTASASHQEPHKAVATRLLNTGPVRGGGAGPWLRFTLFYVKGALRLNQGGDSEW